MPNSSNQELLCGPFVRRLTATQVILWFVSYEDSDYSATLFTLNNDTHRNVIPCQEELQSIRIGEQCVVHQIQVTLQAKTETGTWPEAERIYYQLSQNSTVLDLSSMTLAKEPQPNFIYRSNLQDVIQGSCRKPDHFSRDAFVGIKQQIESEDIPRPDYLIMAGDQIYADDVATPMLVAIQTLSKKLGLYRATYPEQDWQSETLDWRRSANRRSNLMPRKLNQSKLQKFWHGDEIISSRFHDNHLIALDEFFACYLLTWSSHCWRLVDNEVNEAIKAFTGQERVNYQQELVHMQQFARDLPNFEVLLANHPVIMIFDDHDVTDDWNLTADWEEHVYDNSMTRHIIRDALLSYSVFQGWGNDPERIEPLISLITTQSEKKDFASTKLSEAIFDFDHWHFHIDTQPKIIVLDTRTHRWRSEISTKKPSGLLDWDRLEEFEKELYECKDSAIVVSAAPVFGVKAIEVVQKVCEMMGKELLVDVENWMAHQGSAKKLMEILRDDRAPDEVIIVSGDVHYSFCFSAQRRFSSDTDKIWQLTCSGFKNEFPQGLLKFFDYIDRFLYSKYSLLNVFTKRRKMAIEHHDVETPTGNGNRFKRRHLHSQSAAGLVRLRERGLLDEYQLIPAEGQRLVFSKD